MEARMSKRVKPQQERVMRGGLDWASSAAAAMQEAREILAVTEETQEYEVSLRLLSCASGTGARWYSMGEVKAGLAEALEAFVGGEVGQ
jgi:hypothetical protein